MTIQSILSPVFVIVFPSFFLLTWTMKTWMMQTRMVKEGNGGAQAKHRPQKADLLLAVMEWLFALSHRGIAFALGTLIRFIVRIMFASRILVSPAFGTL